jgi:polyribonucleotide nucleotidyltransferase
LTGAREGVNENAPRITTINVPKEKIREIIGTGGKVIREICEKSGAKVDIEDDGTVRIAAVDAEQGKMALDMIQSIVQEAEIGQIYTGKVVRIVDFGAFVNFMGSKDGLVHVSELADRRVEKVTDVVNEGDTVKVKVIDIERGKVRLSMKVVDQETGEDITDKVSPSKPRPPREDRGDRPRREKHA